MTLKSSQDPLGKIYDAVTNGVNNWNMPGFSAQLETAERWGVVAYVRALQIAEQPQMSPRGLTTGSRELDSAVKPRNDRKGVFR
jgi:mono/diheme cytochrome c family protein